MRILLIRAEDQTTRSMFVNSGFLFTFVQGVDQTLKCLADSKEDLSQSLVNCYVVNIPSLDWVLFCRSIRNNKANAHVPIIAAMRDQDFGLMSELMDAGINDFIIEPFRKKELIARLEAAGKACEKSSKTQDTEDHRHYENMKNSKDLYNDLTIAKNIQKSVLSESIHQPDLKIEATYVPAEVLAGDFYCWFPIDDTRYGIMVLDVMGHGVASSLIGMSVRSLLRGMITRLVCPENIVKELNRHMLNLYEPINQSATFYLTMIYLMVDTYNQEIHYVNAGHPPGLAVSIDGSAKRLSEGCVPIGLMPEIPIVTGKMAYEKDLRLLLYTDGIFEHIGGSISEGMAFLEENLYEYIKIDLDQFLSQLVPRSAVTPLDDICLVGVDIRANMNAVMREPNYSVINIRPVL